MQVNNVKLSESTIKDISSYSSKKVGISRGLTKVVDGLYSDGVLPEMMFAPKKDESRVFYQTLELAVVLGFSTSVRAMLECDVKTLAEIDEDKAKVNRDIKCKANRRYWQMQIGSCIKDMRNSLAKRLKPARSDGAEEDKSSWESTKRKVISEIITQAQKKETSTINDIGSFIKDLQSALARIPATA
jgi:hypothetical protein